MIHIAFELSTFSLISFLASLILKLMAATITRVLNIKKEGRVKAYKLVINDVMEIKGWW